ncbi:MAG: cation-translocating P-type ATPase, partial [Fimbriimonadales bacterium]
MFTRETVRIALGLGLALSAEALGWTLREGHPLAIGLALGAVGLVGLPTLRKGVLSLLHGRLNIHLLMTVAVVSAMVLGHWGEAAVVISLYALAELLEDRALERSERTLQALLTLHTPTATMWMPSGEWQSVAVDTVRVGARLRVAPGERIPLDGTVVRGTSTVDQSPITGESVPIEKQEGDPVYAGSLNQYGALEITVTAEHGATKLDQIARTVQEAQAQKTRTERWIDRFAQWYTPVLFGLAVLVALLLPPIAQVPYSESIYRALVLLVLGCPCALVISVPVTILSALTASARMGVLVRGGRVIEQCAHIQRVLFDKTGTLTLGKPQLVRVVSLDGQPESVHHQVASSLAHHSEHPIAQALRADALPALPVDDFKALPGMGMVARLQGQQVWVGNHRLIEQVGRCSKALEEVLENLESQGYTVVVLFDSQPRAVFALQDLPRPSAKPAIAELHTMGIPTA